jgi:hypothetical protein
MTAQQPERYATCSKGFRCIDCGLFSACQIEPPCSRPHTPAPDKFQFCQPCSKIMYTIEQITEIDKRIRVERTEAARTATLAAYDIIDIEIREIQSRIESSAMGSPLSERERGRIIGLLDVRVKLESLRQQAGEQE